MKKITTATLLSTALLTLPVMADHMEEVRVIGQKDKMVVVNGVRDLCIIDTEDVLLITKRERVFTIKPAKISTTALVCISKIIHSVLLVCDEAILF